MHSQLVTKLVVAVIGMFAFAFALVPLYDVFCDVTGLNGKPELTAAQESEQVDESRQVDVGFISHIQNSAPFAIKAEQDRVTVQPGKLKVVRFSIKNLSNEPRVMQAIPSVAPGLAAKYMHKLACFCFDKQTLAANEEKHFELRFYLDTDLPDEYAEVTLSYTLYDISDKLARKNIVKEQVNEYRI